MPIALPKETEGGWLNPELMDAAKAIEFARVQAITEFVHHAVNPRVNNSRSEGAGLMERLESTA